MFSTTRKQGQQIAQQLLAGHCGLVAWWALRHAGVLDAIRLAETEKKGEGLDPLVHATRTSMSPEVLQALLEYLAGAGLVVLKKNGAHLTADGDALLDQEDGVLQLVKAYQPVLDMAEHLLAKLKSYGSSAAGATNGAAAASVYRKSEYLVDGQTKRYAPEVFPTVAEMVAAHKLTHVLDITCGSGEQLIHIAGHSKKTVGVGIGADGSAVRRANAAITQAGLESRLIAVTANPMDVCTDTQRTFDRIGISRQLWKEIDCLLATNLFSEYTTRPEELVRILTSIPKNFPNAHLMLIEPVASARFERNYYAAELSLLLKLARSSPWPPEKWRESLSAAKLSIVQEEPLTTDGLTIFLCKKG